MAEKNPLRMVIYIAAVLAAAACIGYLIYSSGLRRQEYEEIVQRTAAKETEFVMQERHVQTESETETETETLKAEEKAADAKARSASVLVLNGTGRQGVAGYWKTQLENAGYTNVFPASYTGEIKEETVIYDSTEGLAEALKQQFPNAEIKAGTVETGIEAAEGSMLPASRDIFIVIGRQDARSE